MSTDDSIAELLTDVLAPLGSIKPRKMFGGYGIYCDGQMFGLIADGVLYFKADDKTKTKYEAEGLGPFVYEGKTKPVSMSYWRIPERLYDEDDEMRDWARTSVAVARKAATLKAKSEPRKSKKAPISKSPARRR